MQHSELCLKSCSLEHSRELYIEKSIETQLCKHVIPYSILKFIFLDNHSMFKLCMLCITKNLHHTTLDYFRTWKAGAKLLKLKALEMSLFFSAIMDSWACIPHFYFRFVIRVMKECCAVCPHGRKVHKKQTAQKNPCKCRKVNKTSSSAMFFSSTIKALLNQKFIVGEKNNKNSAKHFIAIGIAHSLIPCMFQKFFFTWYL